MILKLIVFLPLIAAIIAGLGGRVIGKTASKVVTTGALMIGAILSWVIFVDFLSGNTEATVVTEVRDGQETEGGGGGGIAWESRSTYLARHARVRERRGAARWLPRAARGGGPVPGRRVVPVCFWWLAATSSIPAAKVRARRGASWLLPLTRTSRSPGWKSRPFGRFRAGP